MPSIPDLIPLTIVLLADVNNNIEAQKSGYPRIRLGELLRNSP